MENRARGEETYIVINTTGEPLSSTENIKPILLGSIEDNNTYNEQWEEREDWFWQNRGKDLCADDGMKQFFVWFWQSRLLQEFSYKDDKPYPIDPKKEFLNVDRSKYSMILDEVNEYFMSLKDVKIREQLNFIQQPKKNDCGSFSWLREQDNNIVLPLLSFIQKYPKSKLLYAFIRRIRRNWFDLKRERHMRSEEGKPAYNYYFVDWRYLIQIIKNSESDENIFSYDTELNSSQITQKNVRLNQWFNEDERNKVALCDHSKEKEQKLWEWEDNKDIMGDLSIIWKVLNQNVNWTDAEKVYKNYNILLNCFCDKEYVRKENNSTLINLANYYRLFRVLRGYYAPGHIDYTKNMNGAWFSKRVELPVYFHYMLDPAFAHVLSANNIEEMLLRIKIEVRKSVLKSGIVENFVPCINDDNFNSISYLKLWLTSKVLWAEKYGLLLSYHDGAGIAAWDDCQKNKIDVDLPFSVANSHCGYAVCRPANRIAYVANENKDKEEFFDTMISVNKTIDEVNNEINDLFVNFLSYEEK